MLRARADSVFQYGLGTVQLYARTEDGSVNPVAPEIPLEGATTSYAVVRDSAGTVLLLIETPTSPREWNNEYRHYFDAAGHTVFFRRYSGFFDGCEWGMAKETLERSYTATFKVARELYSITNDAGSPQDSTRCKFDFHFPYEVFPSWDAAAAALRIPATARQQPA
jgi:hypothetical protein